MLATMRQLGRGADADVLLLWGTLDAVVPFAHAGDAVALAPLGAWLACGWRLWRSAWPLAGVGITVASAPACASMRAGA